MNRQQAEHILDAYVQTLQLVDNKEPSNALREVILDVMTEYKPSTFTIPNVTYPATSPLYDKPTITC